jgi:predicted unusual protein kinase regulating ubiquinone biosynthesis (AarF/ABC1/UbiB family)
VLEAKNTKDFGKAMSKRGLDSVCAPNVVDSLVRNKLLVTEWVQGTRLDRDASPDVPRLCGVAINAYLTMLLDTGVLHCDPHVRWRRERWREVFIVLSSSQTLATFVLLHL